MDVDEDFEVFGLYATTIEQPTSLELILLVSECNEAESSEIRRVRISPSEQDSPTEAQLTVETNSVKITKTLDS